MQFVGEHLVPGHLGHFLIITSFVASLFSAFCYLRAVQTEHDLQAGRSWHKLARGGFYVHVASVVGIFATLFYVITNHLFEYHYAWEHSSLSLPKQYLLACFWEGQEGSFMLWTFWHCVLGLIVIGTAKGMETRVMSVVGLVQVALGTMILGFYIGQDVQVGSDPFILLRTSMQNAPIFQMSNYMDFVQDGNGLNVSLQNYWMVIHPPVLFLGFATSLMPFAYCIAALWKGDNHDFVRPTLAWSLFNGAVLGTGIMMGGAWAYESLNFGGYWAWDPVENASLVPWLTLVAGLHLLLLYRSTGRALTLTFMMLILTHLLVWYSTFLTRTGILGKTSVHAFTGDGSALTYHILVVMAVLLLLSVGMLVRRWRSLPRVKTEEATLSREFWMFVGSVVLFLSSVQIIISTSIPIWAPLAKAITGKEVAPPTDPMRHYNNIQVWIAIVTGLLSATILYMRFRNTEAKQLGKRLGLTAAIALVMACLIAWGQNIATWQYDMMLFAACYGIVANIYYGIVIQHARFSKLGASVAHLGFATVLLGILLSSYNKHAISFNTTGINFDLKKSHEDNVKENRENEILFFNVPVVMGDYMATYIGDSEVAGKDKRVYYKVQFEKKDSATHQVKERFMLYPDAFINPKGQQGLSSNPSTKHYWDKDVFTYINVAADNTKEDTTSYRKNTVRNAGDTIYLNNAYMVFDGFSKQVEDKRYHPEEGDLAVTARLKVYDLSGQIGTVNPLYILRNRQYITYLEDTMPSIGLYARFAELNIKSQDSVSAEIMTKQTDPKDKYIVLKALVFPYINVLWLGVIITVFGFLISLGDLLSKRAGWNKA
jgi:cytochrome c-type biogenesis protein CcmF